MSQHSHVAEVLIQRLHHAMNAHDLDVLLSCFHSSYTSEHVVHPEHNLDGAEQVRTKWLKTFQVIPNFRSELIGVAFENDTAWVEWRWFGHQSDGTLMEWQGVTLFGLRDNQIVWGRPYMELVERW